MIANQQIEDFAGQHAIKGKIAKKCVIFLTPMFLIPGLSNPTDCGMRRLMGPSPHNIQLPPNGIMLEKQNQAAIYRQLADVGGALSNPHRLKMISLLAQGEKPIDELAQLTNQSLAAASANVKVLRNCHLIATEKRGRSVYCSLKDPRVAELWLRFRDLGEVVVPEIREVMREEFDADEGLSPLTESELNDKLDRGRFTLLDLRPASEFEQGHLPKARSVPFASLAEAAPKLPKSATMLVYCRGPFCAAAFAGNRWLREHQFKSQRLRFSVPEWRAAGLSIERN